MYKIKTKKGITLIALIITIVVLLVLAVVGINVITESGLISKSQKTRIKYKIAEIQEQIELVYMEEQMASLKVEPNALANRIIKLSETKYPEITNIRATTDSVYYTVFGVEYEINLKTGKTNEYVDELAKVVPKDPSLWVKAKTNTGYKITGYTGTGEQLKDVIIPNVFIEDNVEIPVTDIALNNIDFKGILTIPSNITISNKFCVSCINLEEVIIGNGVILNGGHSMSQESPFKSCTNLKRVKMGRNIQIKTGDSRYSLFRACPSLTEITIESLDYVGTGALCNAYSSLKGNIVINEGVTTIGGSAFWGCNNIESVSVPKSLINIGGSAFMECKNIKTINLPSGLQTIGDRAFEGCKELNIELTIKSGTSLGTGAFNSSGITKLIIEDNIEIKNNSFVSCSDLKEVIIGNGVILKGGHSMSQESPFKSCTNLKKVKMGRNIQIKTVDSRYSLFRDCPSLTEITVESFEYVGVAAFWYGYTALKGNVVINNGVTKIEASAFWGCNNIESITIPDSVTDIGQNAFRDCSKIKTINLPKGLQTIGDRAFNGCIGVTYLYVDMKEEEFAAITKGTDWKTGITVPISYKTTNQQQ